ncbi:MAG: MOSC domain-containing protein [Gammaproteobacteria bacterium]|nr:MOSC domain-containing protein [Gammaproteobacteria bacterium]MCP5138148.1 MOSC domain-containing protein [Gammaproteobacteria bacterium]
MSERRSQLFAWLSEWRSEQLQGRLEAIHIANDSGADMRAVSEIEAIVGRGLEGDRYADGKGHWRLTDGCEVTLVSAEALRQAEQRSGVPLSNGAHRRNLVVSGIALEALRRHVLKIGEVQFAFHKLRPPCAYLDRVARPGSAKALKGAGGVGLRVIRGGVLRVGDTVEVLTQPG